MIKVYSTANCSACKSAKNWLEENNLPYESMMIDEDVDAAKFVMMKGLRTVPQIFVGEEHIGGWDDMRNLGVNVLQQKVGGN